MKQQETYWDEEAQEFYTYEQSGTSHSKTALYIVGYFLLLAIIVVPAQRAHMGMQGLFAAMIGTALLIGVCILVMKFVMKRVRAMELSKKGVLQMMVGFAPEHATQARSGHMDLAIATPTDLTPLQGPPDQILEEYPLHIADAFRPSVRTLLGTMVLLCGIRRSGKSNLLAVLVEELARYEVPLVIFDTEDEYGGLASKDYLANPVHVGSPGAYRESANKDNYVKLDNQGAYAFGRAVLDNRLQAVINLKSWDDDEAAVIMAEMIDGLNDWEDERENADRIPVMCFLDEAQKWLPQNLKDGWVSRENQTLLHHAFFDIVVARGGKRGFGLICATQRYSQLNKNVLQSQWKFLFKQTEEIDVGRYAKQGLDEDEVRALQQGECYIFSPLVIGFKTMIRERNSPHQANTPGLENLMRNRARTALPVRTQSFVGTIEATAHTINDYEEPHTNPPATRKAAAPTLVQRGVSAYKEGATSQPKLAAALDITPWEARQLMPKVEAALSEEVSE